MIYSNGKQLKDILYVEDLVDVAMNSFSPRVQVYLIWVEVLKTASLLELPKLIEDLTRARLKLSFSTWRKSDQKAHIYPT
jgi:CDP-paratose 2-epimerase